MSERKERIVDILKALGFVLVGFFGGIAAAQFVEGFRDGFNESVADQGAVERDAAGAPARPD
jgi:hypothetical protein